MTLLAQITEAMATPVGILIATNGATITALGAVYRDCKREREKLWTHIRELERRVS